MDEKVKIRDKFYRWKNGYEKTPLVNYELEECKTKLSKEINEKDKNIKGLETENKKLLEQVEECKNMVEESKKMVEESKKMVENLKEQKEVDPNEKLKIPYNAKQKSDIK